MLIIALIFLFILSLIVLSATEEAFLENRMSTNVRFADEWFYIAEKTLLRGINSIQGNHPTIHILTTSTDANLSQKSHYWWQQNGNIQPCLGNCIFLIEDFATDSCAKLAKSTEVGVKFYRISARVADREGNYPIVLQAFYAIPFTLTPVCANSDGIRTLHSQLQAWRRF